MFGVVEGYELICIKAKILFTLRWWLSTVVVLNRNDFVPWEHLAMSRDISGY